MEDIELSFPNVKNLLERLEKCRHESTTTATVDDESNKVQVSERSRGTYTAGRQRPDTGTPINKTPIILRRKSLGSQNEIFFNMNLANDSNGNAGEASDTSEIKKLSRKKSVPEMKLRIIDMERRARANDKTKPIGSIAESTRQLRPRRSLGNLFEVQIEAAGPSAQLKKKHDSQLSNALGLATPQREKQRFQYIDSENSAQQSAWLSKGDGKDKEKFITDNVLEKEYKNERNVFQNDVMSSQKDCQHVEKEDKIRVEAIDVTKQLDVLVKNALDTEVKPTLCNEMARSSRNSEIKRHSPHSSRSETNVPVERTDKFQESLYSKDGTPKKSNKSDISKSRKEKSQRSERKSLSTRCEVDEESMGYSESVKVKEQKDASTPKHLSTWKQILKDQTVSTQTLDSEQNSRCNIPKRKLSNKALLFENAAGRVDQAQEISEMGNSDKQKSCPGTPYSDVSRNRDQSPSVRSMILVIEKSEKPSEVTSENADKGAKIKSKLPKRRFSTAMIKESEKSLEQTDALLGSNQYAFKMVEQHSEVGKKKSRKNAGQSSDSPDKNIVSDGEVLSQRDKNDWGNDDFLKKYSRKNYKRRSNQCDKIGSRVSNFLLEERQEDISLNVRNRCEKRRKSSEFQNLCVKGKETSKDKMASIELSSLPRKMSESSIDKAIEMKITKFPEIVDERVVSDVSPYLLQDVFQNSGKLEETEREKTRRSKKSESLKEPVLNEEIFKDLCFQQEEKSQKISKNESANEGFESMKSETVNVDLAQIKAKLYDQLENVKQSEKQIQRRETQAELEDLDCTEEQGYLPFVKKTQKEDLKHGVEKSMIQDTKRAKVRPENNYVFQQSFLKDPHSKMGKEVELNSSTHKDAPTAPMSMNQQIEDDTSESNLSQEEFRDSSPERLQDNASLDERKRKYFESIQSRQPKHESVSRSKSLGSGDFKRRSMLRRNQTVKQDADERRRKKIINNSEEESIIPSYHTDERRRKLVSKDCDKKWLAIRQKEEEIKRKQEPSIVENEGSTSSVNLVTTPDVPMNEAGEALIEGDNTLLGKDCIKNYEQNPTDYLSTLVNAKVMSQKQENHFKSKRDTKPKKIAKSDVDKDDMQRNRRERKDFKENSKSKLETGVVSENVAKNLKIRSIKEETDQQMYQRIKELKTQTKETSTQEAEIELHSSSDAPETSEQIESNEGNILGQNENIQNSQEAESGNAAEPLKLVKIHSIKSESERKFFEHIRELKSQSRSDSFSEVIEQNNDNAAKTSSLTDLTQCSKGEVQLKPTKKNRVSELIKFKITDYQRSLSCPKDVKWQKEVLHPLSPAPVSLQNLREASAHNDDGNTKEYPKKTRKLAIYASEKDDDDVYSIIDKANLQQKSSKVVDEKKVHMSEKSNRVKSKKSPIHVSDGGEEVNAPKQLKDKVNKKVEHVTNTTQIKKEKTAQKMIHLEEDSKENLNTKKTWENIKKRSSPLELNIHPKYPDISEVVKVLKESTKQESNIEGDRNKEQQSKSKQTISKTGSVQLDNEKSSQKQTSPERSGKLEQPIHTPMNTPTSLQKEAPVQKSVEKIQKSEEVSLSWPKHPTSPQSDERSQIRISNSADVRIVDSEKSNTEKVEECLRRPKESRNLTDKERHPSSPTQKSGIGNPKKSVNISIEGAEKEKTKTNNKIALNSKKTTTKEVRQRVTSSKEKSKDTNPTPSIESPLPERRTQTSSIVPGKEIQAENSRQEASAQVHTCKNASYVLCVETFPTEKWTDNANQILSIENPNAVTQSKNASSVQYEKSHSPKQISINTRSTTVAESPATVGKSPAPFTESLVSVAETVAPVAEHLAAVAESPAPVAESIAPVPESPTTIPLTKNQIQMQKSRSESPVPLTNDPIPLQRSWNTSPTPAPDSPTPVQRSTALNDTLFKKNSLEDLVQTIPTSCKTSEQIKLEEPGPLSPIPMQRTRISSPVPVPTPRKRAKIPMERTISLPAKEDCVSEVSQGKEAKNRYSAPALREDPVPQPRRMPKNEVAAFTVGIV